MKTFDLDAYGVMEMNEAEMQKIEGGNLLKTLAIAAGCVVAVVGICTGDVFLASVGVTIAVTAALTL